MKKIDTTYVPFINGIIAVICFTIVAILACSCSTSNKQTNADAYIHLLEHELELAKGDNYVIDAISGTDAYNAYYGE